MLGGRIRFLFMAMLMLVGTGELAYNILLCGLGILVFLSSFFVCRMSCCAAAGLL